MNKTNINVPRLNANDDDVEVIDIYINNGEQIKKGQKLFTFETSKTAIDFNSEYNGEINGISSKKFRHITNWLLLLKDQTSELYNKEIISLDVVSNYY